MFDTLADDQSCMSRPRHTCKTHICMLTVNQALALVSYVSLLLLSVLSESGLSREYTNVYLFTSLVDIFVSSNSRYCRCSAHRSRSMYIYAHTHPCKYKHIYLSMLQVYKLARYLQILHLLLMYCYCCCHRCLHCSWLIYHHTCYHTWPKQLQIRSSMGSTHLW